MKAKNQEHQIENPAPINISNSIEPTKSVRQALWNRALNTVRRKVGRLTDFIRPK